MRTLLLILSFLICSICFGQDVYVSGYYRSNGTYVQGHYRTAPNSTINDNYSTVGNVNPYTGKAGTVPRSGSNTTNSALPIIHPQIPNTNSSYSSWFNPLVIPPDVPKKPASWDAMAAKVNRLYNLFGTYFIAYVQEEKYNYKTNRYEYVTTDTRSTALYINKNEVVFLKAGDPTEYGMTFTRDDYSSNYHTFFHSDGFINFSYDMNRIVFYENLVNGKYKYRFTCLTITKYK